MPQRRYGYERPTFDSDKNADYSIIANTTFSIQIKFISMSKSVYNMQIKQEKNTTET